MTGEINLHCDRCRQPIVAPVALTGELVNCPSCGELMKVPFVDSPPIMEVRTIPPRVDATRFDDPYLCENGILITHEVIKQGPLTLAVRQVNSLRVEFVHYPPPQDRRAVAATVSAFITATLILIGTLGLVARHNGANASIAVSFLSITAGILGFCITGVLLRRLRTNPAVIVGPRETRLHVEMSNGTVQRFSTFDRQFAQRLHTAIESAMSGQRKTASK